MINIAYTIYELEASCCLNASSSSKRQGILFKITFPSGNIGYADCHPWPELGDLSLQEQLKHLAQGQLTPLTRCALEFARLDAEARSIGQPILSSRSLPPSHFLVIDFLNWTPQHVQHIIQQGYTHLKLKVGHHIEQEIHLMNTLFSHSPLKLRLDFNETLTFHTFLHFLQHIQTLKNQIDFIEDPFPFHAKEWSAIQKDGWNLACDRKAHLACHQPEAARILIIKPAFQSSQEWKKWTDQTRIVTSYLGHPLEQMTAAYIASHIDPFCHLIHGLLSHHAYHPNSFSQHLNWKTPQFTVPAGSGFGFDKELEELEWKTLQ